MYPDRLEFKNDPLASIDPRCRLAAGAVFIFSVLHITNPLLLLGLTAAAGTALVRDIKTVLLRLAAVNLFCALLFITMPLGGSGLAAPLLYALRINAASLFFMLFVASLGIGGLAPALTKLKINAKLVSLLILSYRYLFVMYDRIFHAVLSMRLRRPRQTTMGAWHSYTALFASAFAGAFFRSRKISRTAQARGFDGAFPLTRILAWKIRDTLILLAAIAVSILLIYLDKTGGLSLCGKVPGRGPLWRIYR
ncbi:MAG: energy-coupling factor transporter transmembrane protein EcfT [Treponema sp.]|jgi:cobalt/nickel transport system permease protein|nr:energy-coupling factor transporter transmembrane protein EcfT [Treponema sp.]